jgi:threonine/homoserine/homoserine lactone efflux protein
MLGAVPPPSNLLAFVAVAAVVILIPGPSVLFTVGRALSAGRREALLTVIGNAAGEAVQVVAVAVGLGSVISASDALFAVLKIGGALYLVYLGIQAIRHRGSLSEALQGAATPSRARRALRQGFVVGLTNPKTTVFFAAILPQFVDRALGHVPLQMLVLGSMFPVMAVALDSCWALGAGTARDWFARSPRRLAMVGGAGGLAMIGVGVGLIASGRKD